MCFHCPVAQSPGCVIHGPGTEYMCLCVCVCVRLLVSICMCMHKKEETGLQPPWDMESDQWLWPVGAKQPVLFQSQNFQNRQQRIKANPEHNSCTIDARRCRADLPPDQMCSPDFIYQIQYINDIYMYKRSVSRSLLAINLPFLASKNIFHLKLTLTYSANC